MENNNILPGVSIVIVTYNSFLEIEECVSSVYSNNDIGDCLEIIVVDNNSNDFSNTESLIHEKFPQVVIVKNESNGGYGQGNNIGISRASYPIVLIMNPDVRLYEPVFCHAISVFSKSNKYLLLGMQQYSSKDHKGASYLPKTPSICNLMLYKICSQFSIYLSRLFFISGACFFLKREEFLKIGGFDENIFLYGEETDLNERILANNYKIRFDDSIGYIHPVHKKRDSLIALQRSLKSALYIAEKYGKSKTKLLKNWCWYYKLLLIRSIIRKDNNQRDVYRAFIDELRKSLRKL